MKKISVLFATLFIVAISLTSCKKVECVQPVKQDTVQTQSDSTFVEDSI